MEQVYYENTAAYTVASTAYSIRLRPTLILKNFLPVDVICCLQGVATEYVLRPGQNIDVCTAEPDHSTVVLRVSVRDIDLCFVFCYYYKNTLLLRFALLAGRLFG